MRKLILPDGYTSKLSLRETQKAIKLIKDTFQLKLAENLNLERVTAPVIVKKSSGINDDLNGVERKVEFDMKEVEGVAEVVQSLAKWKRLALSRYNFGVGEGLYTDMNALRRDDDCDNIHSLFVDQWDWEKIITADLRNLNYLKDTVSGIVKALYDTQKVLESHYPVLKKEINKDVFFITSQELLDMYPSLSGKERENEITKKYGTVFIMQIGKVLSNGEKHDGRAPDYDDWSLNGDLLVWNAPLGSALELSSMGIRVDAQSLKAQLEISGSLDRLVFDYHKGIINNTLPLTIGGGIGQSRLCMYLLEKAHIGEVQVSIWPDQIREECLKNNINLL